MASPIPVRQLSPDDRPEGRSDRQDATDEPLLERVKAKPPATRGRYMYGSAPEITPVSYPNSSDPNVATAARSAMDRFLPEGGVRATNSGISDKGISFISLPC